MLFGDVCFGDEAFGGDSAVTAGPTAPSIATQPQSQSVTVGQVATFTVVATGTAPLAYQWRRNGVDIAGATGSSYSTAATVLGDNGAVFSVRVTNAAGGVTSANATLTVTAAAVAPSIVTQPQPRSVAVGEVPSFSVVAAGTAPLAYQWRRDGVDISGATSATYTMGAAQLSDDGAVFSVRVSNGTGSVVSSGALLSVSETGVVPELPPPNQAFHPQLRRTVRYSVVDPEEVPDLSPMRPEELVTLVFDFAPWTSVSAPAFTVARSGGADGLAVPSPSGAAFIVGAKVLQRFTGGTPCSTYEVACAVTGQDNSRVVAAGRLPVR